MNAIDATERKNDEVEGEPRSLLTIILDTNPHAWALLHDSLSLSKVVASLQVFVNAHIAINNANRVAVLASHAECAEFLYPPRPHSNPSASPAINGHGEDNDESAQPTDDANKYRPFALVEHALTASLRKLAERTTPAAITSTPATMMAGALTMALTYISKQTASAPTTNDDTGFNYSDANAVAGDNELDANGAKVSPSMGLVSRILVLSVSGDLANQYIPIMNSIFACQRLDIPIDILKLSGDTVFLQQAADATGGMYMALDESSRAGFLQYLMFAYLPDQSARKVLNMPSDGEGVDFRAACFCHRRVVDIGYVCSICLSIFCEPLKDGTCLTCGSHLTLAESGRKLAPKKKKKKKIDGAATPNSQASTPRPS